MNPTPRKLPVSQGWQWIHASFALARRHPSVFPLMGLVMALISWLPLLGGLILLVAGPALVAGTVMAADAAASGRRPVMQQLLGALAQPGQRGEALKLCIPLVVGKLVAGFVLAIAATTHLLEQGMTAQTLQQDQQKLLAILFSQDMMMWWGVALLLVMLAWSFIALAIPKVALERKPAFPAMGESLRQVWHNPGPWVVTALSLFCLLLVVTSLLWLTGIAALAQLGIYTVLYTLLGPLLHAAWRDLDGGTTAPTDQDPPPGPPPPPRGVLEA